MSKDEKVYDADLYRQWLRTMARSVMNDPQMSVEKKARLMAQLGSTAHKFCDMEILESKLGELEAEAKKFRSVVDSGRSVAESNFVPVQSAKTDQSDTDTN